MPIDRDTVLKKAETLLGEGRLDDAIREYVRLVEDQPRDWNAINALGDLYVRAGDAERAVEQFTRVADFLYGEGFFAKAAALYKKALKVQSDHEHTLARLADIAVQQGLTADARFYLQQLSHHRRETDQDAATEDPDLLLGLAHQELAAGRQLEGRAMLTRALAVAPDRYPAVVRIARGMIAAGRRDAAYECVEVAVDAAVLESQFARAADVLEEFLQHGAHIPALRRLVQVAADGRLEKAGESARRRLDDALAAGAAVGEAAQDGEPIVIESLEVDLTDLVADLRATAAIEIFDRHGEAAVPDAAGASGTAPPAPAEEAGGEAAPPPKDLETVFEEMRGRVVGQPALTDAHAQYTRGLEHLLNDRIADAIDDLQAAARTPLLRFSAAAQLGRLYIDRGDVAVGIDWLERATEAPAPTPEDGFAVLYDLAHALGTIGESARALAVLMELDADAGNYRDVRHRIDELTRAEAGSTQA